jgi:DNA invertase Pin-like site-specific DNA recombinase
MNDSYVVSPYLRLSSDDGLHGDSHSIAAQREMIAAFLRSHPELKTATVMEFSDDGYSGTNFRRPGVTELLRLARTGAVNCIIVKDFSRFGRNYIEVGDYIEQIFPFLRIRFISVNDAYDSQVNGSSAGDVSVAFKHLANDYYSKDLSRKVKSGYKTKWEAGKYLSSYGVYGYRKSKADKYRLEPDEETAPTVRRIFDLALSGEKPSQIAAALNAEGVPTPLDSLTRKHNVRGWSDLRRIWTGTEIGRILRNLRYTGAVTGGAFAVEHIGSRQARQTPQSEWYISHGMHEPLVTKEEFERAQLCVRSLKSKGAKYGHRVPSPHSLPVTVRCGGCGHALVKNGAKAMAYYCRYRKMAACETCFSGKIEVETLKGILLEAIRCLRDTLIEHKQKKAASMEAGAPVDYLKEIGSLQREMERIKTAKLDLYNSYSYGGIDRAGYISGRQEADGQIEGLAGRIEALEREYQSSSKEHEASELPPACESLREAPEPQEYSNELAAELIDHVVVHDESRVEIVWRFKDLFCADAGGKDD